MQHLSPDQETSSPTVNLASLFLVLSIAAKRRMLKRTIDIAGAYLNADIDSPEQMYLNKEVSQILVDDNPDLAKFLGVDGKICVDLLKAQYGIGQSSSLWFKLLSKTLVELGYTATTMDPCVFYKTVGDKWSYLCLYVDDIAGAFDDQTDMDHLVKGLEDKFGKVTGTCGDKLPFLGMQINTGVNGDIVVNQSAYLENLMRDFDVSGTADYPFGGKFLDEDKNESGEEVTEHDYLSLAMSLMYLSTRTRPDILYPNIVLSGRTKTHLKSDYDKLYKILEYLNGTRDLSLVFRHEGELHLNGFVDASFNCHPDARGHTGFVIFPDLVGSSSVLSKSLKQKSVADSSAEAELIALHESVQHLLWVIRLAEELGFSQTGVPLHGDNQATLAMASKEQVTFKGRSKFINRKFFSVHQHVEDGTLKLVFVGTDDNIADFLTKAVMGGKFHRFRIDVMGSVTGTTRNVLCVL